jgi:outer membrane protein
MSRSILFLLFSFLYFYEVEGQSQYTLQQCIDRALQYNIQIKQSSLSNDLNKIQVTQSAAAMLPNVSGNASQNYYYGRSIDPYTNTYTTQQVQSNSFSLSSNLTLFEGLQLQNTLRESKLNYLSSQNELKKIQNDIKLNVVNSFLQVLYNEELRNNSKSRIDASKTQRDKMKRMFELGSVNKGNYLELESQVASDDVTYVQAQSQYEQSLL